MGRCTGSRTTYCRALWAVCAAMAALGVLDACSHGAASDEEKEKKDSVVAEVSVAHVERSSITSTLAVSGTINARPNQDVRVSSLVAGRVVQMTVAEGDPVKQDQVLARIDDTTYRDQLRQAEGSLQQARAQMDNARLARQREETLLERGISARREVEDARTQEKVAEAAVQQATAAVALARLQVSRTEVRSPIDGTVVKRIVSVGEQVDGTANQPLFQVANLSSVELFANVPAEFLGKIRVGQKLEISTEAFPDVKFDGRVAAISPAVDPATNMGLVRIEMANSSARLRHGMYLSAQIPLETHAGALVVPRKSLYRDESGATLVYKVEGDVAHAVPVTPGITGTDRVELLGGVQPGDTVILEGGYGLPDGARVKVRP